MTGSLGTVGPSSGLGAERELDLGCAVAHVLLVQARGDLAGIGDEAARRRREAHQLLMRSAVPLAVFDGPMHALQFVNHAWRELLGSAQVGHAELDAVFRTGTPVHIAERAFGIDAGREVYCGVAMQTVRGPDGEIVGVIVVCSDITDAVIARRLAVPAEALVWGGPPGRAADYYNRRWREDTGVAGGEWKSVVHPDDLPRCVGAFGEAARQRVSTDIEVRIRRHSYYCWHRVRFTIGGPAQRWFGSAVNIHDAHSAEAERTELLGRERAARADAEQANRLKDQFLAAVSHELRAPLTTMLLWEKVLRDDTANTELRAKALDAIHQSAIAQTHVVGDLLDISRAISGKLFVDLRPIAIESIVRDAIATASAVAVHKQIAIAADVAPRVGEVLGDAHRLRQIFDNLLSNAVKFTEPGGRVSVSAHRAGRFVVIAIADTGRGIAPEFLPRLFEPFSQTDDALTRAHGGLGLGLSIAHQLVMLHQGTLVATSAGRGRGATLTITLPAVAARRAASSASPIATSAAVLEGIRVLIIDDDRRVRDALAILLGRSGAVIAVADSAASARLYMVETLPDLLVCDIAMPDEDGYSFVRTIREASAPISALPVIALTAHATIADGERALVAGFDLHLAKPIDLERLVTSIHDLVAARRSAPT